MPQKPLIFIAFGVTGELMKRKILPALAQLREKDALPKDFKLVGISRRPADELKQQFGENFYHIQGDANEPETYTRLKELLDSLGPAQKIFYISTSPALYQTIFTQLLPFAQDSKLMIEKPFGLSGADAEALNKILHTTFDESQIYRVDHYLGKEDVLGLHIGNTKEIKSIEVSFLETDGVEKRGASYDAVGALRDVGQNHALEMFAASVTAPGGNRADAIEALHALGPEEVAHKTAHEQYKGYVGIAGVKENSQTETYFKIETNWNSAQVIFEGGKHQKENKKSVTVTYADSSTHTSPIGPNKRQDEYERLILDCVHADHTLFIGERELTLLWRFIDPIIGGWKVMDKN